MTHFYFERIPVGEIINAVKIVGRSKDKLTGNNLSESMYDCICTLCNKEIRRKVSVIISGAVMPCDECRIKYNMRNNDN